MRAAIPTSPLSVGLQLSARMTLIRLDYDFMSLYDEKVDVSPEILDVCTFTSNRKRIKNGV